MTGILLLAAGIAGILVGGTLAATLVGLDDPLDWALAAGVFAAAQVVVVSLLTGAIAHHFTPGVALATTAATDIILTAAIWRRRPRSATLGGVLAAATDLARRLTPWQAALCALAALAFAWRLVLALLLPPFAYDALTYHLTAVADWVQRGRIEVNPYALCCGHYPSNAELLFAWPTMLMHRDTLTETVQIGVAVVGALAVAGLARWAGVTPGGAAAAAALFLLTPIVLTQANVNYNDLTVASFLLTAVYFTTRFLRAACFAFASADGDPCRKAFLLGAAVATGLALGSKIDGVLLGAILTLLLLTQLGVALHRGRLDTRRAAGLLAVFVAVVVMLGGWWYLRNWIQKGNPVWPYHVDAFGMRIFDGPNSIREYLTVPPGGHRSALIEIARSWYHDLTFFRRGDYSYEEREGGLGPLWSWLGWAFATWLVVTTFRRRPDIFVGLVLPLALLFALEPYRWWSRFTISLASVGAIALIGFLERMRAGAARGALAVAVLVLVGSGVGLATWRLDPAGRGATLTLPRAVSLVVHPSRSRTVGSLFFPEYRWLREVPAHATLVVETNARSIRFLYPLFGSKLDRTVVQLLENRDTAIRRRLELAGPVYLAVETHGWYDRWARARPKAYHPVFDDLGVSVYRRVRR